MPYEQTPLHPLYPLGSAVMGNCQVNKRQSRKAVRNPSGERVQQQVSVTKSSPAALSVRSTPRRVQRSQSAAQLSTPPRSPLEERAVYSKRFSYSSSLDRSVFVEAVREPVDNDLGSRDFGSFVPKEFTSRIGKPEFDFSDFDFSEMLAEEERRDNRSEATPRSAGTPRTPQTPPSWTKIM